MVERSTRTIAGPSKGQNKIMEADEQEQRIMEHFAKASAFVAQAGATDLSDAARLRIYGLFKVVTVGRPPAVGTMDRLAFWDMEARAKRAAWVEVWEEMATAGDAGRLATAEYIHRATLLGWVANDHDPGLEKPIDLPAAGQPPADARQAFNTGPGAVSKLLPPAPDASPQPASLIHDLVLDKPAAELGAYLDDLHGRLPPAAFTAAINELHNGYTPFQLACDQGSLPKVQTLLHYGVDTTLVDAFDGLTGLQLAHEAGMSHIVEFLSR